jgi:hypothetical protein
MKTNRREFLQHLGTTGGAAVIGSALSADALRAGEDSAEKTPPVPLGKADSCIFLWLGGGAAHMDTWDPKRKGDPQTKKPGSYYDPIPTAVQGVEVCEHLKQMAPLLDRCTLVRSVHHDMIIEHAAAVNRVHTGRPTSGTIVYPSIGSVTAHELGARGEGVPTYVVMGYPNITRGPGFLGAKHGYVYLTDTNAGPAGLRLPPGVDSSRQSRREQLLAKLSSEYLQKSKGEEKITSYAETARQGLALAGPNFMKVFDLKSESSALRGTYGDEFGQRCLLARRLVESGVRFVEVAFNLNFINGTGWDTHNQGQLNQHILIQQLDRAMATLMLDLEKRDRLDKTLIVVATEFGRPPQFDGGGGRGHQSKAYSMVLAGGGLNHGRAIGVTDEIGEEIAERPISVPDFHATIYAALGINPQGLLYAAERPVPITDGGKPIAELFG